MRMPSKTVVRAASGLIGLLLASVLIFQHLNQRLQENVETGEFKKRYTSTIDKLHESMRSIRDKFGQDNEGAPPPAALSHLPEILITDPNAIADITLQGISWNEQMPLAMINGKIYRTGEKAGGFIIKKIMPDVVLLEYGNEKEMEIRLMEDAR